MMAKRPRSGGRAPAELSTGRVVEAVLVDGVGLVVVVVERVLLVLAPGASVVVDVLLVTDGVVNRRVVDVLAVSGLRS